jgi:hypothetical protein
MRRACHKLKGEFKPEVPTAMFRGSLFGKALELHYMDDISLELVTDTAVGLVLADYEREGRTPTEAVTKNLPEITKEIHDCLQDWPRIQKYLDGDGDRAVFVGAEIPIRGSIVVDGKTQKLASHVDLLWRMEKQGYYILADCKYKKDQPTRAQLHRDLQFGMYRLLFEHGAMRFPDGEWYKPGADEKVKVCCIWGPGLKPIGRATKYIDADTQQEYELAKGDKRPEHAIVRWIDYNMHGITTLADEIRLKIRMMRAGFWPTNPTSIGCQTCESEQWCNRFDMAPLNSKDTRR